jgi:putative transposase
MTVVVICLAFAESSEYFNWGYFEDKRREGAAPLRSSRVRVFDMLKRNPLQRRYGQGDLHFITLSCVRRRPLLGTPVARDCFVRILAEVRNRYEFRLIGYVVMPEHVHLLMSEPRKDNPSRAMQVLKQRVSIALLRKHSDDRRTEEHFWQKRFYDFNVYSGKKITEKLSYMHMNPLNRKLVTDLKDWPWSSWSHYANVGTGLISIDRWDEPADGGENPHP